MIRDLAQQFFQDGQHAMARALWLDGAAVKVEDVVAHQGLTYSYIATQEYKAAEPHAQIWRLLEPNNPQAHWLYAQLIQLNGRAESEALRAFLKLEQLAPDWQGVHLPIAKIYFGRRQIELSKSYFERALQTAANEPDALRRVRWEYAMLLLTMGEYERGWLYHEERLGWLDLNLAPLPAPRWQGENLRGKTIVVHGEQGIGDEIMYASMLNDLLAMGAKVVLACYSALVAVMRESFPTITVVPHPRGLADIEQWQQGVTPQWWRDLKRIDYQVPMGSLAHILGRKQNTFPRTPYLKINADVQRKQQQLLEQQAAAQGISLVGKKLIALAWCGNLDNPHGRAKSIELSQLAALADEHIVFVSLQNRQYGAQALTQKALPIVDMSQYTDEFIDTLALASLCAQIVTIDTAYFHLCAAAGLPVTLLLRRNCDWRFGWVSDDCDWYAQVDIIRQSQDLIWDDVVPQLRKRLT